MPTSPPARPTDHARPITGTQLPLGGLDSLEHIVNVSQVAHRSPFRYPGGKTWFVPRIRRWLAGKGTVRHFVEPFAGGGIVGLSVAFEHLADHVTLIELDDQVAAVWKTLLESPRTDVQWLIDRILGFSMTRAAVLRELEAPVTGTREQAFLTILKNRVYHGGVLADGAGLTRHGDEGRGIGQRWYPDTLARRIIDIQQVRSRITFVHGDAFSFLSDHCDNPDVVYFVDPPYSVAGSRLYRHGTIDHQIPAWKPPASAVGRKSGRRGAPDPGGRPWVLDYIEYSCIMYG